MKTVLLTHAVTKWSFAVVALAVSLLGLPESQKASVSRSVNHIFHTYFEFPRDQGIQLNKNRFVPNLSRVDPETAYYFNKISRYSEKRPFEKGPVLKWNKDIKMFLHGDVSKSNKKELVKVVIELNRLIYPLKIKLVEHASLANSFVFFGSLWFSSAPFGFCWPILVLFGFLKAQNLSWSQEREIASLKSCTLDTYKIK